MSWLSSVREWELYTSVLVVGEIRQGIERLRRRDPAQAEAFDSWLERLLREYADRVVPVNVEIAEEWGRMNVPDPLPAVDALMVAIAKAKGMTFVTHNTAEVARTGVKLLNPLASSA